MTAGLILVSFLLCVAGGHSGAALVYYGFPVLSIAAAAWLLLRRRWYSFIVFNAWLWLLTPFLRRVVDWKYGYHPSSLILIPPAVAGLLAIPVALRHRRRVDRTIGSLFVFAGITFVYGAVVGLLSNGVTATGVDVLAILGPFGIGLFVLLVPEDDRRLRRTVLGFAVWATIVIGAYGVVQFVVAPAWDTKWMIDTGIQTSGQPKPGQIRVFSTLNTSNPFGEVVAATLLVALAGRRMVSKTTAVLLGLLSLGLSLVRAAWIAIACATVALVNNGRVKLAAVVAVIGVGVVALMLAGGSITTSVSSRLNSTVSSGSNDLSLNSRLDFQRQIAGPTIANPIGKGMGSTGTALKIGTDGAATDSSYTNRLANFDSGIFENATTYGSVLGFTLFGWLIAANVAAWRRSRRGARELAYCAAAVTMLMISMFFTNTLKNAPGFLLWVFLALAARAVPAAPSPSSGSAALRPLDEELTEPAGSALTGSPRQLSS